MRVFLTFMVLLTAVVSAVYLIVGTGKLWVFLNGDDAEMHARKMLSGNAQTVPDKFINYSISAQKGFVIFVEHNNHSILYGYFADKPPSEVNDEVSKLVWHKVKGKWFVADLNR